MRTSICLFFLPFFLLVFTAPTFAFSESEQFTGIKLRAQEGDAYYQGLLAEAYRRGEATVQDFREALKWALLSADKGNPIGTYNLAAMYQYGHGIKREPEKARKLFFQALEGLKVLADRGDRTAQADLATIYVLNGDVINNDYQRAMELYLKAVKQGSIYANCGIGMLYEEGYGVKKDYNEALKWYQKAAIQGSAQAKYFMGLLYESAYKDYPKAQKWYLDAADQEYVEAQFHLGELYEKGLIVAKKDDSEASKWYAKAYNQRSPLFKYEDIPEHEHGVYDKTGKRIGDRHYEGSGARFELKSKASALFLSKSQNAIRDSIINFLQKYYSKKRANIAFSRFPTKREIALIVTSIKGEIIKNENFWERIQITILYQETIFKENEKSDKDYRIIELYCITDGRYSAGLMEPPIEGYVHDIEPKYSDHLRSYNVNLLMELEKYLTMEKAE